MKPLHISFVLGHQLPFPPSEGGGVNNLIWMLARQFRKKGHRVSVCSPLSYGLKPEESDNYGIEHRRFRGAPMLKGRWRNNISGLPYAIRVSKMLPTADITSFHTPFSFLLRLRNDLGICTHTIHRSPKWIVRLYKHMDRIYAGSNATVREIVGVAPALKSVVKAIYNCVEIEQNVQFFSAVKKPHCSFVYVGRFVPDKGLEALIRGAIEALHAGCAISVTTVGPQCSQTGADSGFFKRMSMLVKGEGLTKKIQFLPSITNRNALLACIDEHDVFCMPSVSGETFSIAALEAMARSKPLLTSDYGPMPEMVSDGINGFTAKAGDAKAWGDAIIAIYSIREQLPQMGRQSYNRAKQEFSAEKIAEEYLTDFVELIATNCGGLYRHED